MTAENLTLESVIVAMEALAADPDASPSKWQRSVLTRCAISGALVGLAEGIEDRSFKSADSLTYIEIGSQDS